MLLSGRDDAIRQPGEPPRHGTDASSTTSASPAVRGTNISRMRTISKLDRLRNEMCPAERPTLVMGIAP